MRKSNFEPQTTFTSKIIILFFFTNLLTFLKIIIKHWEALLEDVEDLQLFTVLFFSQLIYILLEIKSQEKSNFKKRWREKFAYEKAFSRKDIF